MERHTLGIVGAVLIAIGLFGAAIVGVLIATSPTSIDPTAAPPGMMVPRGGGGSAAPTDATAAAGRRIFLYGQGHAGVVPRSGGFGMMASGGCANCHGADGRGGRLGGMMGGGIDVPDIRYSNLTAPHSEEGTTEPGFTDAQIAAAIRDGTDPSGGMLSTYMPRWRMDDEDMNALLAYLKQL